MSGSTAPSPSLVTNTLESRDSGGEQPPSAVDRKGGSDKPTTLLLKDGQLGRLLGMSRTKFWALKRAGAFDALKAPLAGYWSAAKVERWLDGGTDEPTGRRHLRSHQPRVKPGSR